MFRDDSKKTLSLRDIAQAADVSISTVSRVLSGSKGSKKISDETRRRILEICERKRFRPNINYRRLHEGLSRVIAFLIPPPSAKMMFFDGNVGRFLSALEPGLARHGFHILMQSATADFLENQRYLELFRSCAIDGAVLWDVFHDDHHLEAMTAENRPLLNVAFPTSRIKDQIILDNTKAAHDLTSHLLQLGHKKIAHVTGGQTAVERERQQGYASAMTAAGNSPLILQGEYTYESGHRVTAEILQKHPEVTAIMAANDVTAAGTLRCLKEFGISCPADISVTGFDGTIHSEIIDPQVTTADLTLDKIGRLAANRIVQSILEPNTYSCRITTVRMPLIIRQSTAPPPVTSHKQREKKVHV